jgi:cell division protein FtsB
MARVALLAVLVLVAGIAAQGVASFMRTRAEAAQQLAIVRALEQQNRKLTAQDRALRLPSAIIRDARALGMVRVGEQSFVVTGLPRDERAP